jgi:MFS family permease
MKTTSTNSFFGWRMVAIAMAIDFFAVGFAFQSYPVIQLRLEQELELTRVMTTLTLPIFMVCSAALYPIVGKLLDSFSIKNVLCVGGLIYGFSLISLYFTNSYLGFILIFALPLALGASLFGNLSTSKLVSQWFNEQTGRALGIAAVGVSFAGFILPLLTQYVLMDILSLTWREVYLSFGIFLILIITPLVWLSIIDHPKDVGQLPDGKQSNLNESELEKGKDWAVSLLIRERNFWVLSLVFALQFSAMMAILSHITLYASEKGWASQAALIFSMYAIPAMLSKIIFGWLVEKKLDPRIAVSVSLLLQGLGIILIMSANSPYQLAAIIALFGFGGGAALPLSNILYAKVFTPKSFGRARGLAQPIIALFQAGGTPLAALLYQSYGNYQMAFWVLASLLVVAIFLIWFLQLSEPEFKEI